MLVNKKKISHKRMTNSLLLSNANEKMSESIVTRLKF